MAKFRASVSKFPYNIIQYTYRIILFLLLKKVCSSFYYSYSSFTKQMKKFLIVQNKKYRKSFFSSKSNISHLAYITGRIRDLGSNSSHETRIARLLATLQLKSFFCIFIHSRRYTLYKLINSRTIISK